MAPRSIPAPIRAARPVRLARSRRLTGPWPTRLLTLAVVLGSGGTGLAYSDDPTRAFDVVGRAGGFEVRYVKLTGQKETSDSAIVASVGLAPDATMLTVDVDAVRARIEALPWITHATVRKVLPATLDIAVEEATPYARWRLDGDEVLIAEDGTVLSDDVPLRFAELPLVVGEGANARAREASVLLSEHPDIAGRATAALLVNNRRWDLLLYSGATVRLPEDGASEALTRLAELESEGALIDMGRVVLDMRLSDRTTVQLRPTGNGLIEIAPEGQSSDEPQDLLATAIAEANDRANRLADDPLGALMEENR